MADFVILLRSVLFAVSKTRFFADLDFGNACTSCRSIKI